MLTDYSGAEPVSLAERAALLCAMEGGQAPDGEALARACRQLTDWQDQGIRLLSQRDGDYPANLRSLANMPKSLFVQGQMTLDSRAVAIVGTRQASLDGLRRASRLSGALARRGVTIVSGLARGIDTAAHRAALGVGGRTVAVLGTGLTRYYPPENAALQAEIAARALLVSQFSPTFQGTRYSFPMRNRVIAGLALISVVVEAAQGSGAQNEAQAAQKLGRTVFLLRSLVQEQSWARAMVENEGALVLTGEEQILQVLDGV